MLPNVSDDYILRCIWYEFKADESKTNTSGEMYSRTIYVKKHKSPTNLHFLFVLGLDDGDDYTPNHEEAEGGHDGGYHYRQCVVAVGG